jgi:hypothetical protein
MNLILKPTVKKEYIPQLKDKKEDLSIEDFKKGES